jgi:hypothetical protein
LIIGGIEVFLPDSPVEATTHVAGATKEEGKPGMNFIKEEYLPQVEEEHAYKMLTPWEKELEMLEDWLKNPEPVDDFHEHKIM